MLEVPSTHQQPCLTPRALLDLGLCIAPQELQRPGPPSLTYKYDILKKKHTLYMAEYNIISRPVLVRSVWPKPVFVLSATAISGGVDLSFTISISNQ